MFVIKNVGENKFIKHNGETGTTNESYPWELVDSKDQATSYQVNTFQDDERSII